MDTSKLWWKLVAAQIILCCACVGCKKTEEEKPATGSQPQVPPPAEQPAQPATPQAAAVPAPSAAPVPVPGPAVVAAGMSGTLTITPNPVPICDKTGAGIATVHWTAQGANTIEVHVGSPDGKLFLAAHGKKGETKTGPWVTKDYKFYLQAVDNNAPHNAEYTIAAATADTVGGGPCP